MSSVVRTFCNQICNLAQILVDRFPDNKELKLALTALETLRTYNPKKTIDAFLLYAYKYRQNVSSREELAQINFNEEFQKIQGDQEASEIINDFKKTSGDIDILQYIMKHWHSLDVDEQDNIIKYLQVLMTLCDKYIAENLKQ